MSYVKDFLELKGWEPTVKEWDLFRRCYHNLHPVGNDPMIKRIQTDPWIGVLLYCLVKRNKLRKILDIGTNEWLQSLTMAFAGGWVVSLSNHGTFPGNFGILNAYKDRVFQVTQRAKDYLSVHKTKWDLVFIHDDWHPKDLEILLPLLKGNFVKYLIINKWGINEDMRIACKSILGEPKEVLSFTDIYNINQSVAVYKNTPLPHSPTTPPEAKNDNLDKYPNRVGESAL